MKDSVSFEKEYTMRELLSEGTKILEDADIFAAENDAWIILSDITGYTRTDYIMRGREILKKETVDAFFSKIHRRANHEPLQYIEGYAPFMGYDFYVTPSVLIPRMDTEVLVCECKRILELICKNRYHGERTELLDMCTGSGCIAISLVKELNKQGLEVKATASDISFDALDVAKKNANRLGAEVKFVQGDLFENIDGKYDMIVSNPPYIRTRVIETLEPEVKDCEPVIALDGYEDGLYFYREIIKKCDNYIKDGGYLAFEIGFDQGAEVSGFMKAAGFKDVVVINDLAGLDRVVIGRKEG